MCLDGRSIRKKNTRERYERSSAGDVTCVISFHITLAQNVILFTFLLFRAPFVWRKIVLGTEKGHLPSRISLQVICDAIAGAWGKKF